MASYKSSIGGRAISGGLIEFVQGSLCHKPTIWRYPPSSNPPAKPKVPWRNALTNRGSRTSIGSNLREPIAVAGTLAINTLLRMKSIKVFVVLGHYSIDF